MKTEQRELLGQYTKDPEGRLILELFATTGKGRPSPIVQGRINAAEKGFTGRYGNRKLEKLQVCSHEAAHVICGHNAGFPIEDAQVYKDGEGYAGVVHFGPYAPSDDLQLWLLRQAVGNISGYAGEECVGLSHPSSSIPEKFMAAVTCNYLDTTRDVRPGHYFEVALRYCSDVIKANRYIFDQIRWELLNKGRVNGNQAATFLAGANLIPLTVDYSGDNK